MAIDNKTKAVFDKFFSKRATIESPSEEEKKNMHEEETAIDEPVTKNKKCCEGKSRLSESDRKKLLKMLNLSKACKKEAHEEEEDLEKEAASYAHSFKELSPIQKRVIARFATSDDKTYKKALRRVKGGFKNRAEQLNALASSGQSIPSKLCDDIGSLAMMKEHLIKQRKNLK